MATRETTESGTVLRTRPTFDTKVWAAILPILLGIFALLARLPYIGRSFDIFIDEVTYLQISRSVGFRLQLELANRPFFLHPPLWFLIEGAYVRLFGVGGNLIAQVYATRVLVAIFAAVSTVLVFLIVRRGAGWIAGLIAAALFVLDPFVIKLNSLNMLETSAMMWVLAGYWVIISALPAGEGEPLSWRRLAPGLMAEGAHPFPLWRQLLTGLFFGFAILTKEMMVLITLAPVAIFFILRWPLARRALAVIAGLALGLYAVYVGVVAALGDWNRFVFAKTHGFVRFAGFVRSTGFKRPGGPSLAQTALDRMTYYGSTYLLIAIGVLAILVLLRRGGTIGRVMAVWAACTYAMLSYGIFLGTLEEQFFYYLVVACIVTTSTAAVILVQSLSGERWARGALVALAALFMVLSGFNAAQWWAVHTTPNDGFANVLAYLHQHVPRGHRVASTSETGQYVLQGYLSPPWGTWDTPEELIAARPDFVLVTPRTVRWNNAHSAEALLDWTEQNGTLTYVFGGRENNVLRLYRLPWASAEIRNDTPPLSGPVAVAPPPANGSGATATAAPAQAAAPAAPATTPTPGATATTASQLPAVPGTPATAPNNSPTRPAPATALPMPATAATQPPAPTAAPQSTETPTPAPTAGAAAAQGSAAEALRKVAAAESALESGRLEVAIYYKSTANTVGTLDFDLRDANGGPRYKLVTTYPGKEGLQTIEQVSIGLRTWQRHGDGPWTGAPATVSPWEEVQVYLPQAAGVADASFAPNDRSVLQWHDAARGAEVYLKIDPQTGTPIQMRRTTTSTGAVMVVDYALWNGPVEITAPVPSPV